MLVANSIGWNMAEIVKENVWYRAAAELLRRRGGETVVEVVGKMSTAAGDGHGDQLSDQDRIVAKRSVQHP